ncbi:lysogeny pheromone AimP family peptide, partial [Bacillus inaquosorum]|nr:lysogeny pheromone AimP family peptide [Bacillus inaquosorum]
MIIAALAVSFVAGQQSVSTASTS